MGENLRYTAPRFIGTEGVQFTVARDDGALGVCAEPADDYDVMMAEREALKAAQERAAIQVTAEKTDSSSEVVQPGTLYEGLGLVDQARTRRSQSSALSRGVLQNTVRRPRRAR